MGEGFETLLVEDHGQHVRVVTLNRPKARNALNIQMGNDVVRFFEGIAADPGELRCPVLTGAGDRQGVLCRRRPEAAQRVSDREWELQHLVFERMARAIIAARSR